MRTSWMRALLPVSLALSACGAEIPESQEPAPTTTETTAREALLWDDAEGRLRRLSYVDVDGIAVHGGDILLGPAEEVEAQTRALEAAGGVDVESPRALAAGTPVMARRWPGAVVPYTISSNLPNPERVTQAIAHWEKKTRLNFVLRTSSNAKKYPNYINFRPSTECSSYVGMLGGQQQINVASWCDRGGVIHEIGHAVGFWHEHGRSDRDKYIRIYRQHIHPDMASGFDKDGSDSKSYTSYDYDSVMHYSSYAGAIQYGLPTILKANGQLIGVNEVLSANDVAAFNRMYPK